MKQQNDTGSARDWEAVKMCALDRQACGDLWARSSQNVGLWRPFLHRGPFAE